jgi:hypothetical protein
MDIRVKGSTTSRATPLVAEQAAPTGNTVPVKAPEQAVSAPKADVFEARPGAAAEALQRSASVAAVQTRAVDPAQQMRDYLTGVLPPPADFKKVMGYEPIRVETKHGTRMQDPDGSASAPYGIGPDQDFDAMAKTHDYGYDLLRYFGRTGQPLGPEARKAADAQFRQDLFHHANDKKGLVERWKSRSWAQIYAVAVELNSKRQNYGVP